MYQNGYSIFTLSKQSNFDININFTGSFFFLVSQLEIISCLNAIGIKQV